MGRCTEREALHQHLVARTDATGEQPEMDRRRARGEGHDLTVQSGLRVRHLADILPQIFLKAIDIGSQGHHPVRVERFLDVLLFPAGLTHVGQTQIDSIRHYIMKFSISVSCDTLYCGNISDGRLKS